MIFIYFFIFALFTSKVSALRFPELLRMSYYSTSSIPEDKVAEIKSYLQISESAYCVAKTNSMPRIGTSSVVDKFQNPLSGIAAHTAVDTTKNKIYVVFRGTANVKNWVMNLLAGKLYQPKTYDGEIHLGFYLAYISVRNDMIISLQKLVPKYKGYTIDFVGHSLGGAIATLAIADAYGLLPTQIGYMENVLQNLIPVQNASLFTVGSPRVGTPKFAKSFNTGGFKRVIRFVNKADLVPHVPSVKMGFQHVAGEVWINPDNQVVRCDDTATQESTTCGNYYTGIRTFNLKVKYHLLRNSKFYDHVCPLTK